MNDCKNCANAVFDEVWGEYKCSVRNHRIYDVDKYIDCENHKPKEKKKND